MNKNSEKQFRREGGAAVLVISISLLLAVTLLLVYAARVGLLDQKISGNELRHKVAFANAEAGMEQAASFLRANPALHDGNAADGWDICAGTAIFPCDLAGATQVFATVVTGTSITSLVNTTASSNGDNEAYLIQTAAGTTAVGRGFSDDDTGEAIAQVRYAKTSLLTPGKVPPLMAPTATLSGNFNIVPDPNGGGPGVAISAWLKTGGLTPSGNWKTCHHGEFKHGTDVCIDAKGDGTVSNDWLACSCDNEISNSTNIGDDIVIDAVADYPSSPFAYVFGDDSSGDLNVLKAEVKARAEATGLLLPNCDTLQADFNALGRPALVWIDGDCTTGSNSTIGSRVNPIILVVDGQLQTSANSELWGVFVGLGVVRLNGGPVVHGSTISEVGTVLTNGTYYQVYDEDVFSNLRDDTVNTDIAKIAYSWRDF